MTGDAVRENPDRLSARACSRPISAIRWGAACRGVPIVAEILDRLASRAVQRFEELYGTGRAANEPQMIEAAARKGRVETLLVAAPPWCWEQFPADAPVVQVGADGALLPM